MERRSFLQLLRAAVAIPTLVKAHLAQDLPKRTFPPFGKPRVPKPPPSITKDGPVVHEFTVTETVDQMETPRMGRPSVYLAGPRDFQITTTTHATLSGIDVGDRVDCLELPHKDQRGGFRVLAATVVAREVFAGDAGEFGETLDWRAEDVVRYG